MSNDLIERQREINTVIYAYRRLFATEDGKIVMKDLKKSCHYLTTTFDENPVNTTFNEGVRSVLLRILQTIKTNPDELMKRVEEQEGEINENI